MQQSLEEKGNYSLIKSNKDGVITMNTAEIFTAVFARNSIVCVGDGDHQSTGIGTGKMAALTALAQANGGKGKKAAALEIPKEIQKEVTRYVKSGKEEDLHLLLQAIDKQAGLARGRMKREDLMKEELAFCHEHHIDVICKDAMEYVPGSPTYKGGSRMDVNPEWVKNITDLTLDTKGEMRYDYLLDIGGDGHYSKDKPDVDELLAKALKRNVSYIRLIDRNWYKPGAFLNTAQQVPVGDQSDQPGITINATENYLDQDHPKLKAYPPEIRGQLVSSIAALRTQFDKATASLLPGLTLEEHQKAAIAEAKKALQDVEIEKFVHLFETRKAGDIPFADFDDDFYKEGSAYRELEDTVRDTRKILDDAKLPQRAPENGKKETGKPSAFNHIPDSLLPRLSYALSYDTQISAMPKNTPSIPGDNAAKYLL